MVGPIEGGAHGWPFSASMADLDAAGYVEEEYFLEGDATAYTLEPGAEYGTDGRWAVQASRTAPFRTRLLVVRPVDSARFNGTVVVNWQNVTAGFELGSVSLDLMADGYAWVGASTQKVGIDGGPATGAAVALKGWDPDRYGTLDHPGDDFSFDIFTQVARAVGPERGNVSPDPMGGLPVTKLLGYGASQSAIRLRAYIDAVHPLVGVFDGFFLRVDFGIASHVDTRRGGSNLLTDSDDPVLTVQGPMLPARIRDDLDVPVLVLNSESEAPTTYPMRQPDTDQFRLWEVAGTAHSGGPAATEALLEQLERPLVRRGRARRDGSHATLADDGDTSAQSAPNRVRGGAAAHLPPRRVGERPRRHPRTRLRGADR
jgi:Alpha/beta hydrolase domain